MSDEQEDSPKLVFKDLGLNDPIKVKLNGSKPVTTGTSTFTKKDGTLATWVLWVGNVENATVHRGRGKNDTVEKNYTGEVIFFPSEKLNEKLIKAANGMTDVEVNISRREETGRTGRKITHYDLEKLTVGQPEKPDLTPNEIRLMDEIRKLKVDEGLKITEDTFIRASKEPHYGGQISEEKAKELYRLLEND